MDTKFVNNVYSAFVVTKQTYRMSYELDAITKWKNATVLANNEM